MVKIVALDGRVECIYVAGPMSGYKNFNYDTFDIVANILRDAGYTVLNPAEFQGGYQDKSWHDYMRYDIGQILSRADAIVCLPGWQESKGAFVEVTVARAIGLPVWDTEEIGVHVHNNQKDSETWAIDHPDSSAETRHEWQFDGKKWTNVRTGAEGTATRPVDALSTIQPVEQGVPPTQETVLEEANRVVNGPRRTDYDHPLDNFERIAALWSIILDTKVTEEQHALCMIAVKMARLMHSPEHRDSITDIAGYAQCIELVQRERRVRETAAEPEYATVSAKD